MNKSRRNRQLGTHRHETHRSNLPCVLRLRPRFRATAVPAALRCGVFADAQLTR